MYLQLTELINLLTTLYINNAAVEETTNPDCIFIMWKDKLHSCQFVTEEVGQNIQPESSKATHLGHHPDQQIQLLFYAAVT